MGGGVGGRGVDGTGCTGQLSATWAARDATATSTAAARRPVAMVTTSSPIDEILVPKKQLAPGS